MLLSVYAHDEHRHPGNPGLPLSLPLDKKAQNTNGAKYEYKNSKYDMELTIHFFIQYDPN